MSGAEKPVPEYWPEYQTYKFRFSGDLADITLSDSPLYCLYMYVPSVVYVVLYVVMLL